MSKFEQLKFSGRNAFVLVQRENSSFWFNCDLQCSGAMLVESRQDTGLMSRYVKDILRDGFLNDFMYGKDNSLALYQDELDVLYNMWVHLRKTNDWDSKYAPGASFTGHDITPEDDSGMRSHPQMQGFSQHRYDT